MKVGEVGPKNSRSRVGGLSETELAGGESYKRADFSAVSANGCRGEISFPFEMFKEPVDQPGALETVLIVAAQIKPDGGGSRLPRVFHHHSRSMSPNI